MANQVLLAGNDLSCIPSFNNSIRTEVELNIPAEILLSSMLGFAKRKHGFYLSAQSFSPLTFHLAYTFPPKQFLE